MPSEGRRKGRREQPLAEPLAVVYSPATPLVADPVGERRQREINNLCGMAIEAYADAHESRADADTTLAALLGAGWEASRRRFSGIADPGLVELRAALDRYLAGNAIKVRLPPLRGARGGKARAGAVRDLAERVASALESVRTAKLAEREAVADAWAAALTVTADRTDTMSVPEGYDAALVDAVRDGLLNQEPVHLIVQRVLEASGVPARVAESMSRSAV